MDVEEVFHMNGGNGDHSYAKNSHLQKKASEMVKHITIQAIKEAHHSTRPNSFGIADLGCSSGPNTLSILRDLVEALSREIVSPPAEIRVCLNDLPTNDFNTVFKSLPDFCREVRTARTDAVGSPAIFISAHPGSFYGRLFPTASLHFVYSSYSLHWLSKIPPGLYDEQGKSMNKGNIYIAESSPYTVSKAYVDQFKEDFTLFLKSRAEELVASGRMVLILTGRTGPDHVDRGNSFLWDILARSLAIVAAQGAIEEGEIDSYDVHFYAPCRDEIEGEIRRHGWFELERFERFGMEVKFGREVASTVRSVQESMLGRHFGEGLSLDHLFDIFGRLVDEEMAVAEIKPVNFVIVLRKL